MRFYITTPIYYVNDKPHIGHAYSTVAADVVARYERLSEKEVVFLTGTDENAQKVADAAEKSGEKIEKYLERMTGAWKSVWKELEISNSDFIRTTEERHKRAVLEIWKHIYEKGDIYFGEYEGLYCRGHEAFLKGSELIDGFCPDHKTKPEKIKEKNYFFRLKKYEAELKKFYEENPDFVVPSKRFNEIKSFVASGLEDISVSRAGQKWGIPVPGDPSQAIYVWFDALINYVSAVGVENWEKQPADVHVVGKDITRFHAIIWPAMLMSAGLPLPKKILVGGFFTVDRVKISKSLGNTIDPSDLIQKYGADALRYFLMREIPFGDDGDFSESKLKERYNADLANGLGNFVARVLALAEHNPNLRMYPNAPNTLDAEVDEKIKKTKNAVRQNFEEYKFNEALAAVWELISFGDEYVNSKKPWETKDSRVISNLVVVLDNAAAMLKPFMPETAEKITAAIQWQDDKIVVKKIENLFPRC